MLKEGYKKFIESRFKIVNKEGKIVPFKLNKIQNKYVIQDYTGRDIILKARQQGFSSLILAIFTIDFMLRENSRSVIVADESENASELLDRVKFYIQSYEENQKIKIPLKYNSKYELFNTAMNSRYTIGTAGRGEYGRSKTITNLHLSEFAFYQDAEKILAGVLQAVVPDGRVTIETTANGFNYFKDFWSKSRNKETTFIPHFYKASDFYDKEFLEKKKKELGRLYQQEYPETAEEAFLTSGACFFNTDILQEYLKHAQRPLAESL